MCARPTFFPRSYHGKTSSSTALHDVCSFTSAESFCQLTISQWSFHLVLFFMLANRDLSFIHLTFEGGTQNGHEERFKSRKFYDFNK